VLNPRVGYLTLRLVPMDNSKPKGVKSQKSQVMWRNLDLFAKSPMNTRWLSLNFSVIEATLKLCISKFMRILP
jgi:hypothetical protein